MSKKQTERPKVTIYINGVARGWRFDCVPKKKND